MPIKLKGQNITNMYTPIELVTTGLAEAIRYGGITDHSQLHGLSRNDHTQYLLSSKSTQLIPVVNSSLFQLTANNSLSLGTEMAQSFFYTSNSSNLIARSNSTLFLLSSQTTDMSNYALSNHSHSQPTIVSTAGTNVTLASASNGLTVAVPNYITTAYGAALRGSGTYTQNTGTIQFANSNGLTFGLNTNGVMTATMEYPSQVGILGIWDGVGSLQTNSSIRFSNQNGISFGLNGSTMTASYTVPGITSFSNSNNVEFGLSGSTITALALYSQSTQTQNLHNVSIGGTNTLGTLTQISSGTMTIAGGNNITLSQQGNAITIIGSAGVSNSHNVTVGGTNTSGTLAQISSGTLTLAGGNNITLSQVGNAITISGANIGGAQTGISGIVGSNATYTSGSVYISGQNNITVGSYASSDSQYIRLSVGNYLTTAAASNHTHGSVSLQLSYMSGALSSSSNGFGLSLTGLPPTNFVQSSQSSSLAGTGFTTVSTTGSNIVGTLSTNGLNVGIPSFLTTALQGSFVGSNTTGITGGSATIDGSHLLLNVPIGSLYFQDSNGITWGGSTSGNTTTVTAAYSVGGGTGGAGGAAIQGSGTYTQNTGTVVWQTGNGLTFGLSSNGVMTASHNAYSATSQLSTALMPLSYSSGFQTATLSTGLMPLAYSSGFQTGTLSSALMPLSYSSKFATGTLSSALMPLAYSSGFQTATLATVFLPLANSTQYATSVLSTRFLTTAANSTHTHGTPTLSLSNLAGSYSSASSGFSLSLTIPASSNFVNTSQTGSIYFMNIPHYGWTTSTSGMSTSIYLVTS